MDMRRAVRWLAPGLFTLLIAGRCAAQYPPVGSNPYQRPAFSPYLNMNRLGATPAQNYYGLVRPQMDFRGSIQQLGQQQQIQGALIQQEESALQNVVVPTGTSSRFLTQSRYFLTQGNPTLLQSRYTQRPRGLQQPQRPQAPTVGRGSRGAGR